MNGKENQADKPEVKEEAVAQRKPKKKMARPMFCKGGLKAFVGRDGTYLRTSTGLRTAHLGGYEIVSGVFPETCASRFEEKDKGRLLIEYMNRLRRHGQSLLVSIFAARVGCAFPDMNMKRIVKNALVDMYIKRIAGNVKTEWDCLVGWSPIVPLPVRGGGRGLCWTHCHAVLDPIDGKITVMSTGSETLIITLMPHVYVAGVDYMTRIYGRY